MSSRSVLRRLSIFAFVIATYVGVAVADQADFHAQVAALYSFEPHKLTKEEIQAKSGKLDEFWTLVKSDPQTNLPLLRQELADPSNSAFFFYDGSKLLLSLSQDQSDQELALRSIPKANLQGIQHTDFLLTIHRFARNGFDTREAAFRILDYPNFRAFIPQHVLTLGQNYALIYMLFPLDEAVFQDDLVKRLTIQTEVESMKSLLLALWYTAAPQGQEAIRKFVEDSKYPAEARTYGKELLARRIPATASISLSSANSLREERRKVMQRPVSDEALMEFDKLTAKLLAKQ